MTQRALPSDEPCARLEPGNETVIVSAAVNDAGVGIDPMDLGRLFDPFFTTKPGGMELGLAIGKSRRTPFSFTMPGIQDGKGQCSSGG
jgi:signal transduction histidine kinase